jgi:hypothetical protein
LDPEHRGLFHGSAGKPLLAARCQHATI